MNRRRWTPAAAFAAAGALFVLLATGNAAGYRYGVSDQAFHVPAVVRALDPAAFPRDAAVIDAQGQLMLFDNAVAWLARATSLSIETIFFAGYLATAALLWTGIVLIGHRLLQSTWATVLLAAVVTLRHRIPRTSANSIEPYFYPRTLAFSLGVLALAALLYRRRWLPLMFTGLSALVHITTGAWFGVVVVVATLRIRRASPVLAFGTVAMAVAALVTLSAAEWLHPLLRPMDSAWVAVIGTKDSLFANDWPVWAWVANLALPVVLLAIHHLRRRRGTSTREDDGIVWGSVSLALLFLATLPLVASEAILPTQLQISRVFWVLDLVVAVYGVALLADVARQRGAAHLLPVAACVALALSLTRAGFVMLSEHPERRLFELHLPTSEWADAMRWLGAQPADVHVLAHPGHAFLYGSSVRVAARRDVVLEDSKDTALALYSRELAMRVGERRAALDGDFDAMSSATAHGLATRFAVDFIVTAGAPLPFPVAYANGRFRIYDMRHVRGSAGTPAHEAGW